MLNKIKQLLCKHKSYSFVRNIYGDEIHNFGGKRSIDQCNCCGKFLYRDLLNLAGENLNNAKLLREAFEKIKANDKDKENYEKFRKTNPLNKFIFIRKNLALKENVEDIPL